MTAGPVLPPYTNFIRGDGFTLGGFLSASPTDLVYCHERHGTGINYQDCANAIHSLTSDPRAVVYTTNGEGPYSFPQVRQSGGCTVTIDLVQPSPIPLQILFYPEAFRGLAVGITNECVVQRGGIGGFATVNFRFMTQYVGDPATDLRAPYPRQANFLTITISGSGSVTKPGALDPFIPLKLYASRKDANGEPRPGNEDPFANAFLAMSSSSSTSSEPWWDIVSEYMSDPAAAPDEMTYECDASLGAPVLADCSRLEYSQLRAPSDTITIGPGSSKVLSSNTCNVTISSSISFLITWAQIGAALDALINICAANPVKSTTGGKAYFGSQGVSIGGKRKRKKSTQVSGLNALPPHVNITMSQSSGYRT